MTTIPAADPGPPRLRVMHFRRMFSVLSESFIYGPVMAMRRRADVSCSVLSLVRMNRHARPCPTVALLESPGALHSERFLGRLFASRFNLSELDAYLWPVVRPTLRGRIRRLAPDVIHAHFGPDGCLIAPVAAELGIPLVVSFYGYDISRLIHQAGHVWRGKYSRLFDSASRVVGISRYIVDRLEGLGADPERTAVLHAGTRIDRFRYRDPAADYRGGPVRCLHVGRLTAKKDPVLLVQAFAEARRRLDAAGGPPLQLTIVGAGELDTACRRAIERLGVRHAVRMLGPQPHDRIAGLMAESHIYTQHGVTAPDGDTEGLGVTFIEASASGLPVISTQHNGIPEVVRHGRSGLLSPEGDAAAMAANLADLAADPARWTAFGRAGREHVEAEFDLDRCVEAEVRLLRRVVDEDRAERRRRTADFTLRPPTPTSIGSPPPGAREAPIADASLLPDPPDVVVTSPGAAPIRSVADEAWTGTRDDG